MSKGGIKMEPSLEIYRNIMTFIIHEDGISRKDYIIK